MDKLLRPERFDTEPHSPNADRHWKHWYTTFENFLSAISEDFDRKNLLVNFVAPHVYEYIAECESFDDAIQVLRNLYVKPKNEIFSRHVLATRRQQPHESLDDFIRELKRLSSDCNFTSVSAEKHKEEAIRDSFISGLLSHQIRQRLLENKTLGLDEAFSQARTLELAIKNSDSYQVSHEDKVDSRSSLNAITRPSHDTEQPRDLLNAAAIRRSKQTCYFCGYSRHPRKDCPAREATCHKCGKSGHFAKVCKSQQVQTSATESAASVIAATPTSLHRATLPVILQGRKITALLDTGSSSSFIDESLAKSMKVPISCRQGSVSMASTLCSSKIVGSCQVSIQLKESDYHNIELFILPSLCSDVILGQDFLKRHASLTIEFGGEKQPITICGLASLNIMPPSLFANIDPKCKPIACKSRRYSTEDLQFIDHEIQRLLAEDIIEPSVSPWRAQVVVVKNSKDKKRMVVDYSQTVNKYTVLDAYPLPRIEDFVNKIAENTVFSQLDMKSAYNQIPIKESDKPYTAFEGNGKLYHFRRIPFGVTNGAAVFQRVMDDFIQMNDLKKTYAYIDDITVCGKTQSEHDENVARFMEAVNRYKLTLNEAKCKWSQESINLLGYTVENGNLRPDASRLQPLRDMPLPSDGKALQRTLGLFAHYSRWIHNFSTKIKKLSDNQKFPLDESAKRAFDDLKADIERAVLHHIDDSAPFVVETDASDTAIAATLSQSGRPVAFFSRALNASELKHSAIEKEAYAIVESIRRWKHFLATRHFSLITDQKSVSFMLDSKQHGKIKNEKIQRWRLDLSCYSFDISYRKGKENAAADALSRIYSAAADADLNPLLQIHSKLGHPGVTRMAHHVRVQNLPYSIDNVRSMIANCRICNTCKPRYIKPPTAHLIKATQPWERLSVDFKGPLPSTSRNKYIFTVIDEFSRFPFAIPCVDTSAGTVIKCLTHLFTVYGMPAYIHSDRGLAFTSSEYQRFLLRHGVASSKTTPYNPQGNGQCERYNGIIWRTILLTLENHSLPVAKWEDVLPAALHSIRSLLCTATNCTPHERFLNFARRTTVGSSVPSWLSSPGPALLRRRVRSSKYDPVVDEVEVLHTTPNYAYVRMPNGRETTVSLRDLAPKGDDHIHVPSTTNAQEEDVDDNSGIKMLVETPSATPKPSTLSQSLYKTNRFCERNDNVVPKVMEDQVHISESKNSQSTTESDKSASLRRSTRMRKEPDRYEP